MSKKTIIGIGELLWDEFEHYRRPGGAPANVAYHANRLGSKGCVVTKIGNDDDGKELYSFLQRRKVPVNHIQKTDEYATGTVSVKMEDNEASYTIHENVAWDYIEFSEDLKELAKSADAICFGSLAQRSAETRNTIYKVLETAPENSLRVFDINLRPPHYNAEIISKSLEFANVVKLNEDEFEQLPTLLESSLETKALLLNQFSIQAICKTKGAKGCEIITKNSHFIEGPVAIDTSKGDSVGVGDSFTAALIHNKLNDRGWDESLALANYYAANMAALKGAMAEVPSSVLEKVS